MGIVGELDVHRMQTTFDYVQVDTSSLRIYSSVGHLPVIWQLMRVRENTKCSWIRKPYPYFVMTKYARNDKLLHRYTLRQTGAGSHQSGQADC